MTPIRLTKAISIKSSVNNPINVTENKSNAENQKLIDRETTITNTNKIQLLYIHLQANPFNSKQKMEIENAALIKAIFKITWQGLTLKCELDGTNCPWKAINQSMYHQSIYCMPLYSTALC